MVGSGLMGAAPARSGTGPGVPDINPLAANILSTLLNPGAGAALANSMAMLQNPGPSGGSYGAFGNQSNSSFGGNRMDSHRGGSNAERDNRRGSYGGRDRSPNRRNNYRQRSRSRSPRRNRAGASSDRNERRPHKRLRENSPLPRGERPQHEIYIGNYPVRFRENDVRKLFEEHGIEVSTIRLKHDGLKVFAFAETKSKEEVAKAVKLMDSQEINGRRLRVRSSHAKEKKDQETSPKRKARRELCVDDVTRHLAFAFNDFLERQKNKEGVDENKQAVLRQAKELIASAFDLPEDSNDESLKISRHLELIFMQNNRREIQPPQEKEDEDNVKEEEGADAENITEDKSEENVGEDCLKEVVEGEDEKEEIVIGDDGNWKRAKKREDEDDEDAEDETIDERLLEHEDDGLEIPDVEEDQPLQIQNSEPALQDQSSLSSPKLEVAIDEENEEDAADIQAIKEEVCQLPDLDLDSDMKSTMEEEKDEENEDMPTPADVESTEITESLSPPTRGRGGGRGRNSGRARRSRGKRGA